MNNFNVTDIRILKSESVYNADADFDIHIFNYIFTSTKDCFIKTDTTSYYSFSVMLYPFL